VIDMQIFVAIQQALDWGASTKDFRIDPATQDVIVSFARYRIDQFDEIALEVGLQYRSRAGGELRAISVGGEDSDDVLRHALAMNADQATLVDRGGSAASAPELLAAAIRHHGEGIVLCGRTSSINGSGRTGPVLAELLGLPFIANVVAIEDGENAWLCRCETAHGYEVLKVTRPFVASVTNADTNLPRVPGMKDRMRAHRSSFETLAAGELTKTATASLPRTRVRRRYLPAMSRACRRIEGTPQAQAKALAEYIRSIDSQA
jgi:electron transfer flavoprotein beta subunit